MWVNLSRGGRELRSQPSLGTPFPDLAGRCLVVASVSWSTRRSLQYSRFRYRRTVFRLECVRWSRCRAWPPSWARWLLIGSSRVTPSAAATPGVGCSTGRWITLEIRPSGSILRTRPSPHIATQILPLSSTASPSGSPPAEGNSTSDSGLDITPESRSKVYAKSTLE